MATPAPPSLEPPTPRGLRHRLAAGRGRGWATGLALLFAALLLLPDPGPMPTLRRFAFDGYQELMPRQRGAQPAIIVDIDDRSLAQVGQWPWPRDTLARLVDRIAARQPAVIGVDIVFTEPDRTSPERLVAKYRTIDPELAERLRRLPSNEAALAAALARTPVVLGVVGSNGAGQGGAGFAPARMFGPPPQLKTYRTGQRSLPGLDAAATGRGLFDAPLEDGVVRRVPLVAMISGYPLLSLPLECLRVAANVPWFGIHTEGRGPLRVSIGDLVVPAQDDGSLFVHYSGHDPGRFLSAVDVLEGRDDPELIAGRVVLLGVTGQGLVDQQLIPNGEAVPGVEVHAEVIENIFEGSLLHRPRQARAREALVFVLLALGAIVWVPQLSPRRSTLPFLASALVLAGAGLAAYRAQGQLYDPLTPLFGLALLQAMLVLATMMRIELERRRLAVHLAFEREAAARTAGELEAATRIQTGMLPKPAQVLGQDGRVELFAHMRPAREVGGDLYDFFYLDRNRLFVAVGDVAGKGLAAAMFMAVSKSLTKSVSLRGAADLGGLMEAINIELARDNPDELFVTLLALVLDLDSGRLEYCNAGHEPLLRVRADGSVDVLDEGGGAPLCVFEYSAYASAHARLQAGDWLVLGSDGITEAAAPDGRLLGRDALKTWLMQTSRDGEATSADRFGRALLGRLAAFEAGSDPLDDQTLMLLRWLGRGSAGRPASVLGAD